MRELLPELNRVIELGIGAALATIVRTSGHAYRRPGAVMLVAADGGSCGSISGGCLESDVRMIAQQVIANGRRQMARYDTTSDDELVWGTGLGCGGTVDVLIEPVMDPAALCAACTAQEGPVFTAARITPDDEGTGGRMLLFPGRGVKGSLGSVDWDREALDSFRRLDRYSRRVDVVQVPSQVAGQAEVFIQLLPPPTRVEIFGAGDDAIPLARAAEALGMQVTVTDPRPVYATMERFPTVHEIRLLRAEDELGTSISLDPESLVVIMNHHFDRDKAVLAHALQRGVNYIGCLGPRDRAERMLQSLRASGVDWPSESLEHLRAPVGHDLGGEGADALATSIVSELLATIHDREGGALSRKKGPLLLR